MKILKCKVLVSYATLYCEYFKTYRERKSILLTTIYIKHCQPSCDIYNSS